MITMSTVGRSLSDILETRSALFEMPDWGRMAVSGDDAIDLLNRLSTNDLERLEPGDSMGTVLTTNKGRVIDLLEVVHRGDDLLLLTSAGTQQRVADWIDFYTFSEDVAVRDITDATRRYLMIGGGEDDESDVQSRIWRENASVAVRADFGDLPAWTLIFSADDSIELGDDTLVLDESEFARLRVERGVPSHPNELNEDRNPLEANLLRHIDFNKGCYIGQEVVARLNTYDRVQRYLCRLTLEDDSITVEPGSVMMLDGKSVGDVTTAVPGMALGFLRKRHYADGVTVEIVSVGLSVAGDVRDLRA